MARPVTILRDREPGAWELVTATPQVALRPHVARYTGWFERRATPLQRREIPSQYIPLIINFGSPIRVSHAADPTRWDSFDLALDCGYYDQPHFDRDFRLFAGVTPTDLLRTLRPDGGFAADA